MKRAPAFFAVMYLEKVTVGRSCRVPMIRGVKDAEDIFEKVKGASI